MREERGGERERGKVETETKRDRRCSSLKDATPVTPIKPSTYLARVGSDGGCSAEVSDVTTPSTRIALGRSTMGEIERVRERVLV